MIRLTALASQAIQEIMKQQKLPPTVALRVGSPRKVAREAGPSSGTCWTLIRTRRDHPITFLRAGD